MAAAGKRISLKFEKRRQADGTERNDRGKER
jgi:hypothetical protein